MFSLEDAPKKAKKIKSGMFASILKDKVRKVFPRDGPHIWLKDFFPGKRAKKGQKDKARNAL